MTEPVRIGLVGCGFISGAYLRTAPRFDILQVKACADRDGKAAGARAAEFGITAMPVDELLADPEIEIVVNLTTPQAHVDVDLQILAAGKHAHSEKPLAVSLAEANRLRAVAEETGLRVGCAPDTFLGGAHQTARHLLDSGRIGEPVAGTAFMMLRGHERWHPNPDFYYQPGGGPMFDMGPYYLTCLVNLLGPVARVMGMAKATFDSRTIESGPRTGAQVPVDVATHISAVLQFASGAHVTVVMSFDVWKHQHSPIEIYGTEGSMLVPDPNHFGGTVQVSQGRDEWEPVEPVFPHADGEFRIIGAADMAAALRTGRPHRASMELAYHVLEVMEAAERAATTGRIVEIDSRCERPAALPEGAPLGRFD